MNTQVKSALLKKGYKYRIYPTAEQAQLLDRTFGCTRYIYNYLLSKAKAEYQTYVQLKDTPGVTNLQKPSLSSYEFSAQLTQLKKEPDHAWLNDVSSVALQQVTRHLQSAFIRFFRTKTGYPVFKRLHAKQSFTLVDGSFRFKNGQLFIAKFDEALSVLYSRALPSEPSSLTISRTTCGQYYVSFICEYSPPKTSGVKVTGIDLGLTNLVTLSDGTKITNPRHSKRHERRLRRLQQSLSKKQKGSRNRVKARARVSRLYNHIANARLDHLHKISRTLINENQVIGVESLTVRNMVRNRNLAKHVQDVAWSTLVSQLVYKARESQHCVVVMADAYYPSSHLCSSTGQHLGRRLTLSERSWNCSHCGQTHDRDINAAQNLAKEASRAIATAPIEAYAGKLIVSDTKWSAHL